MESKWSVWGAEPRQENNNNDSRVGVREKTKKSTWWRTTTTTPEPVRCWYMCTCFVNVQKADMTRLALSLSDDFPKASHGTAFILRSFDAYVCVVAFALYC